MTRTNDAARPACRRGGSSRGRIRLLLPLLLTVSGACGTDRTLTSAGGEIEQARIEQRLDAQVPLDIRLRDETGADVRLEELIGDKPVVLTLVYYRCPMLCNMTLDGQVRALSRLSLDAGRDYTALTVSFDPREDHELAASAKRTAVRRYGRDGAERGWRFLTGEASETRRLADAVGFGYAWDEDRGQYAHAAGLIVLTPRGRVSRYLFGVEFPPRDLRLALVEASEGKVGSITDDVLLLCYRYDPTTGKYGLVIISALRIAGLATVIGLGTAIGVMIRRDRRRREAAAPPSGPPSANKT